MKTEESKELQGNEKKDKLWKVLLCICILGAMVTGGKYFLEEYKQRQAQKQFEELRIKTERIVLVEEEEEEEEIPLSPLQEKLRLLYENFGVVVPEREINFEELHEINEDIYAWIYLPNTNIDYPVLQHPTELDYYLLRNLDHSKGYPGCIYSEYYNTKTFQDRMTILYGHNMRNGTMFKDLHKYEDAAFFEENPYIFIYTQDDVFVYRIFTAHRDSDNHILLTFDFADDDVFMAYLDRITDEKKMVGNINKEVELSLESRVMTLATCIGGRPTERFLVQGVLLETQGDDE